MNGSVSEMISWSKHYLWCELGDLRKDVTWLKATLDRGWSFAMPRNLVSILSRDQKVLTISGHTDGPRVPEGKEESFDLRLERQPDGTLACTTGRWRRYWGAYIEGTFEVKFTEVEMADGRKGNTELTSGEFRVRRQ